MKKILLLIFVLSLSFVTSCGYKFAGGGFLPGKTKFVTVKVFENKTSENGAEIIFAHALSMELMAKSDSKVVDIKTADAYFSGVVKSISISTLTKTSDDAAIERRVSAIIDLRMIGKNGDLLWFVKDFQGREDFKVTTKNTTDMALRTLAITKIAERIAQKVVGIILEDF
jgi:hypothetical protein